MLIYLNKMKKRFIILNIIISTCFAISSCGQINNTATIKKDKKLIIDSLVKLATTSDSLHNLQNSIKYYTAVLDIDSLKLVALINRGRALVTLGQIDKGISDYDKAIKHYPDERTYYARGIAYYMAKKTDKSIQDFTSALAMNPNFGEAYYGYSLYALSLNKFVAASVFCHKADSMAYVADISTYIKSEILKGQKTTK